MKKTLQIIGLTGLLIGLVVIRSFGQNNTFPDFGDAGVGTTSPQARFHITSPNGNNPSYPSTGSRGDILQYLTANNNALELGVAKGVNSRRAWILARHTNIAGFGQYYSTLHLQPQLDITTHYRGVAIGYPASATVPIGVGLAVNGNVGIGTTDPKAKLAVEGTILATEVKVKTNISVPDYVFEEGYRLPALDEIETYIKEHKHLPEIASAAEIKRDGLDLAEMNLLLLKKVEELTLHLIEKDKENRRLKEEMTGIKQRITVLEKYKRL